MTIFVIAFLLAAFLRGTGAYEREPTNVSFEYEPRHWGEYESTNFSKAPAGPIGEYEYETASPTGPTSSPVKRRRVKIVHETDAPTQKPTLEPTPKPSKSPTQNPTDKPKRRPTARPTVRSKAPTSKPTSKPTPKPSQYPTTRPTLHPTQAPEETTSAPVTAVPTLKPTTGAPTHPTVAPTPWLCPQPEGCQFGICNNGCGYAAFNGRCDDGGPGSVTALCIFGGGKSRRSFRVSQTN